MLNCLCQNLTLGSTRPCVCWSSRWCCCRFWSSSGRFALCHGRSFLILEHEVGLGYLLLLHGQHIHYGYDYFFFLANIIFFNRDSVLVNLYYCTYLHIRTLQIYWTLLSLLFITTATLAASKPTATSSSTWEIRTESI